MPHLLTNPLNSTATDRTDGVAQVDSMKSIKRDSSAEDTPKNKLLSIDSYTGDRDCAALISPEQEKRAGNVGHQRTRDARELAALQTMLELPNTPPSPASHSKEVNDSTLNDSNKHPPESKEGCYESQPRSFVPYSSSRGRGAAMPYHARSPGTGQSPQYPPHIPRGGAYSPPHLPYMSSHLHGPRVSQRGGAHGGRYGPDRYGARRPPGFHFRPYYYEPDYPGYYPPPPYHCSPDTEGPSRRAAADGPDEELETEHARALSPSIPDSAMESKTCKEGAPKESENKDGFATEPVVRKERHPYAPPPQYYSRMARPYPYSRYPMHPFMLRPQHDRPRVPQFPPSPNGHPPAHAEVHVQSPHVKHSTREGSLMRADPNASQPRPDAVARRAASPVQKKSLEKCIPLKGPIPSKFWG